MKYYFTKPNDLLWDELCNLDPGSDQPIVPHPHFLICGILIQSKGVFCARAVCYLNPYHVIHGEGYASFGYLYCKDDLSVFKLLSDAIIKVADEANVSGVLGPMNGNTWNEYRLVNSEQNTPFLLEPVTPPYLINFFEREWSLLSSYQSKYSSTILDSWSTTKTRYDYFTEKGIQFTEFDKSKSNELFGELAEFCNQSFSNNFLFSPIGTEDFVAKMQMLLPIINPSLTIIARNNNGDIVGFIFAYEDLLNPTSKPLVIKTLARFPHEDYAGVGSVLLSLVMKKAKELGFVASIHAMMREANISNVLSSRYKGESYRKYALYSKSV